MILFDNFYMSGYIGTFQQLSYLYKTFFQIFLTDILSSNHVLLGNWKNQQEMEEYVLMAGIQQRKFNM